MTKYKDTLLCLFILCAGHGTNLTGESPVTGSLPPSVANHKPKAVMQGWRKWCSKVSEPTNRN